MEIQIINEPVQLKLWGFGTVVNDKDYVKAMFALSGRVWSVVKEKNVATEGKNIWVYGPGNAIFAGVRLEGDTAVTPLELLELAIPRHAYYKHIGPYQVIPQTGRQMRVEIQERGFTIESPYIEIYGHWTKDENKLETELIFALR